MKLNLSSLSETYLVGWLVASCLVGFKADVEKGVNALTLAHGFLAYSQPPTKPYWILLCSRVKVRGEC